MALLRYVIGTAALLIALAAVVSGSRAVREHILPEWTGPLGGLVVIVLSLSGITVASELLGSVGLFRFVPLAVALTGLGIAARLAVRERARPPDASLPDASRARVVGRGALAPNIEAWANWIAGAAVLVVCAEWLTATVRSFQVGMTAVDAIWYHMPTAARFAQTGSTWRLHVMDTSSLTVFYPAGSELLHAVGMAFLHTDALSPVLNLGWLALGLLAAWCIGARYGVAPLTLLGAAVLFATPQLVTLESGQALNDMAVTGLLLAAVAVIVNAAQFDTGRLVLPTAALVVAAMAAGLAVGTKWTALVSVAALTVGIPNLARRADRVRSTLLWAGVVVVTGGYWYLRNLVAVGSPVPPQRIGLGPIRLPYVRPGIPTFSITHSLTDSDVWHHVILAGLHSSFGPVWWLVLLAAVAGLVAGLVVVRDRSVQLAAAGGVACVTSYVLAKQGFSVKFWPGTPRYAAPGLALGLVILPVALSRLSRRALLLTLTAYGAALVATQTDAKLWRAWWPRAHHVPVVVAVVVVAGIGATSWAAHRTRLALRPMLPIGFAVLVGLSLASGLALRSYRPTFVEHGISEEAAARVLRDLHVHHARIALTGSVILSGAQYGFYDKGLTNYVQFIAQRGPDHSVVPFSRCRALVQALAAGHYRYVVATAPGPGGINPVVWLRSIPAARRIDHAPHGRAGVFEIDRKLNPADCRP